MAIRIKPTLSTLAAALVMGAPAIVSAQEAPEPKIEYIEPEAYYSEGCGEEESCDFLNKFLLGDCFTERTGISVNGWVNGGVTVNDNFSTLNGPLSFNDRQDFLLNQLYLIVSRAIDTDSCGFDIGFQVDLLYGADAQFTQALGLDDNIISANPNPTLGPANRGGDTASGLYEMAIPQLYGELFVPVGNGLTVKAGHFYTIIGYEVVTAPDNFFYSHAYTMQYGEPFTHTGVLASYDVNDRISVTSGITRGWNNWEDNNNALSYLGGVSVSLTDNTSVAFALTTGNEQNEPAVGPPGAPDQNRTMYSFVFDTTVLEKVNYIFQHDHGWNEDIAGPGSGAEWYGINQYLIYEINDELSAGVRAEWFRDDDASGVAGVRNGALGTNPGAANYYGFTTGLNYAPASCIMIRPELRWDWQDRDNAATEAAFGQNAAGVGTRDRQFTAAVDVIFKY